MHVVVMLLCALNVPAWIAAAALYAEKAVLFDEAAAACDAGGNDLRSASARQEWDDRNNMSEKNINLAFVAVGGLEVAIRVLMALCFLLFFPACIVMFRRVERRLDAIMQEMNHRSDLGTVFLPYEFSPAAADGARSQAEMQVAETTNGARSQAEMQVAEMTNGARSQVEMQVVEARAFLSQMKSAAAVQSMRFWLCLALVLVALIVQSLLAVFIAAYSVGLEKNPDCGECGSCQNVQQLQYGWYLYSPELASLVVSACSTLPLTFSLWLMTTKEDRELMLYPRRFRSDSIDFIAQQGAQGGTSPRVRAECVRMGIALL
jgi:hypothetical protein